MGDQEVQRLHNLPTFNMEKDILSKVDDVIVAGIDEVGTGAIAGPVCAAAVVLDLNIHPAWYDDVRDSKKLRPSKREWLAGRIREDSLFVSIGFIENIVVDDIGINKAREEALIAAYEEVSNQTIEDVVCVVDGKDLAVIRKQLGGIDSIFRNKADSNSISVGAASIVAKVFRDKYMTLMDEVYPYWGFGSNMGYGTPSHIQALKTYGRCNLHRFSFGPVQTIRSR